MVEKLGKKRHTPVQILHEQHVVQGKWCNGICSVLGNGQGVGEGRGGGGVTQRAVN